MAHSREAVAANRTLVPRMVLSDPDTPLCSMLSAASAACGVQKPKEDQLNSESSSEDEQPFSPFRSRPCLAAALGAVKDGKGLPVFHQFSSRDLRQRRSSTTPLPQLLRSTPTSAHVNIPRTRTDCSNRLSWWTFLWLMVRYYDTINNGRRIFLEKNQVSRASRNPAD